MSNGGGGVTQELVFFPSWVAGRKGYAKRIHHVFQEYLKGKTLRYTAPREKILNTLLSANRHLSVRDIYGALKKNGIGKATVFRTLHMLEECKLVDRVSTHNGAPRFEVKMERPHHDHLICVECGAIAEIQWPEIERIQDRACRRAGFSILWHRHELFGRCRSCAGKRA
jgi:Fur family ferric uptake transcriptional regulator